MAEETNAENGAATAAPQIRMQVLAQYVRDLQDEFTTTEEQLAAAREQLARTQDSLAAAALTAPTDGIVKNVRITTIGGVAKQSVDPLAGRLRRTAAVVRPPHRCPGRIRPQHPERDRIGPALTDRRRLGWWNRETTEHCQPHPDDQEADDGSGLRCLPCRSQQAREADACAGDAQRRDRFQRHPHPD